MKTKLPHFFFPLIYISLYLIGCSSSVQNQQNGDLQVQHALDKYYKAFFNVDTYNKASELYSDTLLFFHNYLIIDNHEAKLIDELSFEKYEIKECQIKSKISSIQRHKNYTKVSYKAEYHILNRSENINAFTADMTALIDQQNRIMAIGKSDDYNLPENLYIQCDEKIMIQCSEDNSEIQKMSLYDYCKDNKYIFSGRLMDIDDDGQNELFIDGFTGGAHCCSFIEYFEFDKKNNLYKIEDSHSADGEYLNIVIIEEDKEFIKKYFKKPD